MRDLLTTYATPYKYGRPVLEGSGLPGAFDEQAVDCPFLFRHQGRYFMLYTGFDGEGYQSALAGSDDLLHWTPRGTVLPRNPRPGAWDSRSVAGTWILRDMNLHGSYELEKYDGRYWMLYHSYPGAGYETGPAEMGLAWTTDEDLRDWRRLEEPVFSWRGGAAWERAGLYKGCFFRHDGLFYLFYNAKNKETGWVEQTGVATSPDLRGWTRCEGNPVLRVAEGTWRDKFVSDPCVAKDGELWLAFFFGFDYRHAQEGIARSRDLFHWDVAGAPLLPHGAEGDLDATHAHKPGIITRDGRLYHFYTAVRPWREGDKSRNGGEYRVITTACSHPF